MTGRILASILVVVLFATRAEAQQMPDEDFRPLRPPVLGYAMEWDAERDVYRVLSVEQHTVLATGSLEDCQAALVSALEEA